MLKCCLLVALTLATNALVTESAAIGQTDDKMAVDQNQLATGSPQCRFCHCVLPPNPKPRDLIRHRLCIKKVLEREGGTDIGGRWGRSVNDKLRRQIVKFWDEDLLREPETPEKHRIPRSLSSVCAGDLSHYDHEVQEYLRWRCKNGYGQLMRRWGRSPSSSSLTSRFNKVDGLSSDNDVLKNPESLFRYKKASYKDRTKRDESDDLRAIVEAYGEWRSQNGYGQTSGRWG